MDPASSVFCSSVILNSLNQTPFSNDFKYRGTYSIDSMGHPLNEQKREVTRNEPQSPWGHINQTSWLADRGNLTGSYSHGHRVSGQCLQELLCPQLNERRVRAVKRNEPMHRWGHSNHYDYHLNPLSKTLSTKYTCPIISTGKALIYKQYFKCYNLKE